MNILTSMSTMFFDIAFLAGFRSMHTHPPPPFSKHKSVRSTFLQLIYPKSYNDYLHTRRLRIERRFAIHYATHQKQYYENSCFHGYRRRLSVWPYCKENKKKQVGGEKKRTNQVKEKRTYRGETKVEDKNPRKYFCVLHQQP